MSSLLPIFPLELVLLPGVPLPLHIFEPRYKEMIAECLRQKKPFGIVRASSDGVADIGCTAEIMSITKKYDDGRMDILARGVERFEVIEVNQERSFLQAEITVVEDEPDKPPTEMVTQAVFGAATMLRESGEHPVILREAVTSPGGTTISAVRELERHGVRAAFLAAIEAARDRGAELGSG